MKKRLAMANEMDIMRVQLREGGIMDLRFSAIVRWCDSAMVKAILVAALLFMCGIFASCGGNSVSDSVIASPEGAWQSPEDNLPINLQGDVILTPSEVEGEGSTALSSGDSSSAAGELRMTGNTIEPSDHRTNEPSVWHNLLNSRSYSGYIAVMFKDGSGVRLREAEKIVSGIASSSLDKLGTPRNDSAVVRRGISSFTEEQIEQAISNAARAGVRLADWNLYYTIEERDPAMAENLIEELGKDPAVEYIYPIAISEPAEVITTANLSGEQDYLQPNETHGGLNIVAGWEAGATGKDVIVVDEEVNWNYDHEDLPIDIADVLSFVQGGGYTDQKYINHGTAVIGIVAGKDNDSGVKGIAHDSTIKLIRIDGVTGTWDAIGDLVVTVIEYWAGTDNELPTVLPGDVIMIEVQSPGPTTTEGCDVGSVPSGEVTGCIPEEAFPQPFAAFKNAVDSGFVVVEGAGNGGIDLGSNAAKWKDCGSDDPCPDLLNDSSGAIMVGASKGANHEKASWTNCGKRVDVYGWGQGVVTAGYGNHPASDPNDQNKWYTNTFGGTSSATAMVGGAVAQIQSYVKKLFSDAGMINLKTVYLTASQIKDILLATGAPAVNDGGCNIGKQPDVAKAIEYAKDKILSGELIVGVHPDPLNKNVVSGIRYDMDGDGHAELISFSRDHKWYIDLSSTKQGAVSGEQLANCEQSADGYCAWDVILSGPSAGEGSPEPNAMLFPVVHDYNSDGRADLALYDSINGKYYIKYTTSSVILSEAKDLPEPIVWDKIIDYTTDPAWKAYSRPVPGDYDGDNWLDIALQTPDGHWLIDYGGFDGVVIASPEGAWQSPETTVTYLDHFGSFDKDVKYLTDDQLAQAPGWAWLGVTGSSGKINYMMFKSPDGVGNEDSYFIEISTADYIPYIYTMDTLMFAGNDVIFAPASYLYKYSGFDYGLKYTDGKWGVIEINDWYSDPIFPSPAEGYGDINCRPIPADYDGDGKDDRAVQCGTTWKIAYTTNENNFRTVELNQALDPLPAYVYAGGIKYQDTVDLYNYYKAELGGTKDSTIFDAPPPIGPYFAQCVKYWAPNASYCWDK